VADHLTETAIVGEGRARKRPVANAWPLRLSLRSQLVMLGVLVAAVLAAAGLLEYRVVVSLDALRSLAAEAEAEASTADTALDVLRDAETAERGFLLTMRPGYLEPYGVAQAQFGQAMDDLDRLARGSPWLREQAAAMRAVGRRKMAEMDRGIEVARTQGQAAAMALLLDDVGKAAMDDARATAARIIEHAAAERGWRQEMLRQHEAVAGRGALAAVAGGVLLLGAAAASLLANRRDLLRARDTARQHSQRLAGTVAHLRDGVAVFDASGRLLLCNGNFFPITGLSPTLAEGDARFERFAAAAADWPGAPLAGACPENGLRISEVTLADRVLELWRGPMSDGGQMLAAADITRRIRAETIARQAQKLDALGQLTGGVAHDFNNLLQVVSANLELLAPRLGGDARLAAAIAATDRAARLTRHLLAFARRQPLAPEAVDTARLLSAFEEVLRRTLGETVQVQVVLNGGLWAVRADPQQLENAILNLAINARDAMPEGGRLTIEASNATFDDAYAAANTDVTPGQYVMIAVSDTGVGMTAEQLARAVEPFFTTKPAGRGTGLGLSMVYGFTRQSGGHFKLYSEPGHGTTARLYIPRSQATPRDAPAGIETAEPARGELVLVVEDDAAVRATATQTLRGLGYRTAEAESAAMALDLLRAGSRPDILFTDVVMPGRPSARELAAEARRLVPLLAVVFTSGYTANAIGHNGQLDPGLTLISKPWRVGELACRLRAALAEARRERTLRVLLVEDDPLVRMTTADLLADLGHEVWQAGSATAAMQELRSPPDLLITDCGLPDMDGLALAARLRERYPGMPVVMATGRQASGVPDVVWLEKPYDQAALRRAIAEAVGTGAAAGAIDPAC
jgi:signal transduction histidine kinase/DNA-binding response OmpR family regulator/CHASE3 domain sensor protein